VPFLFADCINWSNVNVCLWSCVTEMAGFFGMLVTSAI